jgi:hypothetical protein
MLRIAATLMMAIATTAAAVAAIASPASARTTRSPGQGTERFTFMGTSTRTGLFSVIATGIFADGGTVNIFAPEPEIRLANGTIRLHAHTAQARNKLSKPTCILTITAHGTYHLGRGTGRYHGISGNGSFTTGVREIHSRKANGACASGHPLAFQATITLTGHVAER